MHGAGSQQPVGTYKHQTPLVMTDDQLGGHALHTGAAATRRFYQTGNLDLA